MMRARLLLMMLLPTLSACGTTTAIVAPADTKASRDEQVRTATSFCAVSKPIRWSVDDTDETILQSKQHNAVGKALKCPGF